MAPILERIALVVGSNVAPSRVSQSLTLWVWMSLLQHPLKERGFSAYVLEGGLLGRNGEAAPASAGSEDTLPLELESQLLQAGAELEEALPQKAEAETARQLEGQGLDDAAEDARGEMIARQAQLETDSQRASEALSNAQRRKLELQAQLRDTEAAAAGQRRLAEVSIEQMRRASEQRLHEEKRRLRDEYSQAASEMKRLAAARQEAEERFAAEKQRLEEELAGAKDAMESEAQRIREEMEAARHEAEKKAKVIHAEQSENERQLRDDTESRLRKERTRLEAEFAAGMTAQERAKRELQAAQSAKATAQREAERLTAELRHAQDQRESEEEARRQTTLQSLEDERSLATRDLEEAEATEKSLSSTIVRIRGEVKPDAGAEAPAEETTLSELADFEAQLTQASQRLDGAHRAKASADRASHQAQEKIAHQRALEGELRLQLHEEAETWLKEERTRSALNASGPSARRRARNRRRPPTICSKRYRPSSATRTGVPRTASRAKTTSNVPWR